MKGSVAALVLGLNLVTASQGEAQDLASDPPKESPGRYFSKPVDLWKAGLHLNPLPPLSEPPASLPERVAVRENVWAQPIRTPDGTWMVYVPPKQVLDFLESPSEESARAYLAWKAEQAKKLQQAMALLARMNGAAGAGHGAPAQNEKRVTEPPASEVPWGQEPFRITYFKKPSCPHCVSQDAVLSEWLARRSSGTLEVLLPGERPELWKSYQVQGTPTLVLQAGNPPREAVLVGLQSEAALEATLAKLALPPSGPSKEPRKETAR